MGEGRGVCGGETEPPTARERVRQEQGQGQCCPAGVVNAPPGVERNRGQVVWEFTGVERKDGLLRLHIPLGVAWGGMNLCTG